MLLHQTPFDEITEAHLQRLVDVRASESMRLDFKQMLPLTEGRDPDLDASRRFCRDVSAFANTDGGDLVYGMREERGEAVEVNGLVCADQEKYKSKLEDILKDHVEPRIGRVRLRFVPLQSGRLALVLRVPRSLEAPHGVKAGGAWDFYGRRSAGNYAMSVSEIRAAFTRTQDWREGILRWHRARVDLYEAGEGVAQVAGDCRVYVHVVPLGWEGELDVREMLRRDEFDRPLRRCADWSGLNDPSPTVEGVLHLRGARSDARAPRGLALWTHDGRFESIATCDIRAEADARKRAVPGERIERMIHGHATAGVVSLGLLGIDGPYLIVAALGGVSGAIVAYEPAGGWFPAERDIMPLQRDPTGLPAVMVDHAQDDLWQPLRPLMDRLAHAGGRSGSPRYAART